MKISFWPAVVVVSGLAMCPHFAVGQQPDPVIGSITPASVNAGSANLAITIKGTGFFGIGTQPITTILWLSDTDYDVLTATFTSSTQIVATIPAPFLVNAGTAGITASNPGGSVSNSVPFIINSAAGTPPPSLTALTPSSAIAGGPDFTMTVGGTGFIAGATVKWNGNSLTTNFVSTSQLTAAVPAILIQGSGPASIVVSNPGGATSGILSFLVSAPVITFATPPNVPFGAPVTLIATATSGLPVSFASNSLPVCTVSGSTVTSVSAGTCSITASQAGNGTFAAATPVTQTFTITPATQTITFAPPGNVFLGSGTVLLTATATSGLPVSFASTTPSICTLSGSTVTPVSVGSCKVTASQAGNGNYSGATPVVQTFSVLAPSNPNAVTLTAGNGSGAIGRTVEIPISIAASGTAAAAGLQMDLVFDAAKLSFVSARVGEQSAAAGKSLSNSTVQSGQIRLLVAGLNQNTIAAGTAAYASFQLTAGFTSGTSAITAANCSSTDISGNALTTSCSAGPIKYASCDINGDGNTNVSDVQLIINEALGVVSTTHDLNSDAAVNVADVQIVINAALGLGCSTH